MHGRPARPSRRRRGLQALENIDIRSRRHRRPRELASRLRARPEIIESTSDRVNIEFTTTLFIPHMVVVIDVEPIRERFLTVAPFLDERGRRLVAAAEAFAVGYGGIAAVA